jgi:endogenous inhibitor of DNA gyrase (YacG/DUF329 family)
MLKLSVKCPNCKDGVGYWSNYYQAYHCDRCKYLGIPLEDEPKVSIIDHIKKLVKDLFN